MSKKRPTTRQAPRPRGILVGYVRTSSAGQRDSVARQRRLIRQWANKRGHSISRIYEER